MFKIEKSAFFFFYLITKRGIRMLSMSSNQILPCIFNNYTEAHNEPLDFIYPTEDMRGTYV